MTGPLANGQPAVDLYVVLGIDPGAGGAQVARAYRRLARRYHPDVNTTPFAAERFGQVAHAYRVLSDARSRASYDAGRTPSGATVPSTRTGPETPLRPPRTSGPGRSGLTPREAFWLGNRLRPDAFHLGGDRPAPPSPRCDEVALELSIEEAYQGTSRGVTITSYDGTDTVSVVIPPGAITGDPIHVPAAHLPGGRHVPAIILRVRLLAHDRYRVQGRDVHVCLPLSPWEAALGTTVAVDTPAGPLPVDVPAGTSSGRVLAVPGGGIPNRAGPSGQLHAHARIVVPDQLTTTERHLLERLAAASPFNPRPDTTAPR